MLPPANAPPVTPPPVAVSAVVVSADPTLVSRTFYADGSYGECRRVKIERPGWLNVTCRTELFAGRARVEPIKARQSFSPFSNQR